MISPEKNNSTTTASYSVLIGQPVANCVVGNSETTKTTLGGTFELEYSFSVEWTAGTSLGLIGPSAISTTTIRNSSSTKTTKSQEIEVNRRCIVVDIVTIPTAGKIGKGDIKTSPIQNDHQ